MAAYSKCEGNINEQRWAGEEEKGVGRGGKSIQSTFMYIISNMYDCKL